MPPKNCFSFRSWSTACISNCTKLQQHISRTSWHKVTVRVYAQCNRAQHTSTQGRSGPRSRPRTAEPGPSVMQKSSVSATHSASYSVLPRVTKKELRNGFGSAFSFEKRCEAEVSSTKQNMLYVLCRWSRPCKPLTFICNEAVCMTRLEISTRRSSRVRKLELC